MGWTHSWQRQIELSATAFAAAAADLRSLLSIIDTPLAGFDGTGSPRIDDDHVVFNGKAPATCEPFEIARVEFDRRGRNEIYSFRKTEHQPYDLCVQAALIVLKQHLDGEITVSSDGDDASWAEARRLVEQVLGYGQDFKLSVESET